jgi:hypothetical protein
VILTFLGEGSQYTARFVTHLQLVFADDDFKLKWGWLYWWRRLFAGLRQVHVEDGYLIKDGGNQQEWHQDDHQVHKSRNIQLW